MKTLLRRSAVAISAALALLGASAACPAYADPTQTLPDKGSSSAPHSGLLSHNNQVALARLGIDPQKASIQSQRGYILAVQAERWVIIPSAADTKPGIVSPSAAFDAGLCEGEFKGPAMVGNNIIWGAYDSCKSTASPNDLYQHFLEVDLRQGNTDVLSFGHMYIKRSARSLNGPFSAHANVYIDERCDDTNKHHFDVVVHMTVHSIQWSPVVSPTATLACGLAG